MIRYALHFVTLIDKKGLSMKAIIAFLAPAAVLFFSFAVIALPVRADLLIQFEEDAPKDRFIITNASACELAAAILELDLRGSQSGLIFDTTQGGAGENVAQPLEVADGGAFVLSTPSVSDGAQSFQLELKSFKRGAAILLTVDVDDSVPSGPMGVQMISGSEIAGSAAEMRFPGGDRARAMFDDRGELKLSLPACS